MKYAICLLIFLGLLPLGMAQNVVSISFEDLPKLVSDRNENLKAARAVIKAKEERTGHLTRSFLPQLTAQIGEEDFRTDSDPARRQTNWRIGASLNLYRGGRDRLDEGIRASQTEVAKIDSAREFQSELKRARIAFWDVIATEKIIEFRRDELRKNEESLRSARRRAGAGVSTTADAVQFELYRMDLEQKIKHLELRKDLSRNRLAVALGLDEHENIAVKGDFQKVASSELKSLQLETQLDVRAQREREKIETLSAKQLGRWWHPRVDLYANYGLPALSDEFTRAARQDKETATGIILSFDLGQGLSDMAEASSKSYDARASASRAAYKAREALAMNHEIRHDVRLLAELVADNERSIEKARNFLKLTQGEYGRGLKNGPDLLAAFRQFYELQERTVDLQRDLLSSRAELESLTAKDEVP